MAISLSAITDLATYNIGSADSSAANILNTVITSNDLKIEVSLGNSTDDAASEYSSKKLDLNLLVKAIKDYIDEKFDELNEKSDNISAQVNDTFVKVENENRPIHTNSPLSLSSTSSITLISPNITLQSNSDNGYPRIILDKRDNIIKTETGSNSYNYINGSVTTIKNTSINLSATNLSAQANTIKLMNRNDSTNRYIQISDNGTTINSISDRSGDKYKGSIFTVGNDSIQAKIKTNNTDKFITDSNITSKTVWDDKHLSMLVKNDNGDITNTIANNIGGISLKTTNKAITLTTDGVADSSEALTQAGARILLRSGKDHNVIVKNNVGKKNQIQCVATSALWN